MKAAQEQLGHSNMQTTANIYVHVDHEQKEKAANALAAAFPLLLESATFDATFSD
jgi:integrase